MEIWNVQNNEVQKEEQKQNFKFLEQALTELYPSQEITDEMRDITVVLSYNNFGLVNIFRKRATLMHYFVCSNTRGEQALLSVTKEDGYEWNTGTGIKKIKVYLPFSNRIFIRDENSLINFFSKNIDTGKVGLFTMFKNGKFEIEEKYDTLSSGLSGYLATLNNKIGRINPYNGAFNIPIKYDEVVEVNTSNVSMPNGGIICRDEKNNLVLVRLNNKWGAYCYINDYHIRYDYAHDRNFSHRYVRKRFITPLFDKIELYFIDDIHTRIVLKVWLNGKCGLLDVYDRKFIAPIIFDDILNYEEVKNDKYYVYGFINGVNSKYDGENFVKMEKINVEYSETYRLVRSRIEKK